MQPTENTDNITHILCAKHHVQRESNVLVTSDESNFELLFNKYTNVATLELRNVTTLSMSCNTTKLNRIELIGCNISNLHQIGHWNIPNIDSLTIRNKYKTQQLTSLDGIEKFNSLTTLNLNQIYITSLNKLKPLTNLESLQFHNKNAEGALAELDYTPLKQLPYLNTLGCTADYCGNLWELYELELYLKEDDDVEYLIIECPNLQIQVFEKFIILFAEYTKLLNYSTEIDFVANITPIDTLISYKDFIFDRMKRLQDAYDQLEYAPNGPVFDEGLKFFVCSP